MRRVLFADTHCCNLLRFAAKEWGYLETSWSGWKIFRAYLGWTRRFCRLFFQLPKTWFYSVPSQQYIAIFFKAWHYTGLPLIVYWIYVLIHAQVLLEYVTCTFKAQGQIARSTPNIGLQMSRAGRWFDWKKLQIWLAWWGGRGWRLCSCRSHSRRGIKVQVHFRVRRLVAEQCMLRVYPWSSEGILLCFLQKMYIEDFRSQLVCQTPLKREFAILTQAEKPAPRRTNQRWHTGKYVFRQKNSTPSKTWCSATSRSRFIHNGCCSSRRSSCSSTGCRQWYLQSACQLLLSRLISQFPDPTVWWCECGYHQPWIQKKFCNLEFLCLMLPLLVVTGLAMSGLKTGSAAKLEVGASCKPWPSRHIQTLLTAKSDPLQLAAVRSSYAVTRAVCHGGKDRHSTPTKQEQRCSRMQFICLHGQTSNLHRFWSSCVKLKMEQMVERGRDTVTDLYGLDLIRSPRQQATQVVPWRRWRNAMSLFVAQARQKQKLPRQNTASLAAVFSRHENQDAWLRPAREERERERDLTLPQAAVKWQEHRVHCRLLRLTCTESLNIYK